MVGRAAYENPYLLAEVDRQFFASTEPPPSRRQVIQAFLPYIEAQLRQGVPLHSMTRHLFGLFQSVPGARAWRRVLSEQGPRRGAGLEVVETALRQIAA